MAQYDADIQTADELIREFGETAQLVRYAANVTDAAKPWRVGDPVESTQSVQAVFLDFNTQNAGQHYFNGELIARGDKKILMAAKDLEWPPVLQAAIVRTNGEVWKIQNFKDLNPNGQHILYTIQGRA